MKIGILLVNLGTPSSPHPQDVKKYLTEFLTDGRVVDLPPLQRNLLVRGFIVPRRYKKSAKLYQSIWEKRGSPLLIHGNAVTQALQKKLGPTYKIVLAMRYQTPSIDEGLQQLRGCNPLLIFPLFPQYASATTGSVHQKVCTILARWEVIPEVHLLSSYCDHPAFIAAHVARAQTCNVEKYDHILFSYHGLPERQIKKSDTTGTCLVQKNCCERNRNCYAAQCLQTTQAIANQLGIPAARWSLAFQSRLGKTPWLKPYADQVVQQLARKGKKKLLVFSPAFVADCLETIEEIGCQYRELFIQSGGTILDLVPSLNDHPKWVEAIATMITQRLRNEHQAAEQ